jgi:hypothetical protein
MSIEPTIRRATSEEAEACHEVLWASVTDLGARHGTPLDGTAADWWASGEPVHRFLAAHAAEWWVGRALIERAFPVGRGNVRSIIATTDVRALTRYYGADTAVRFPILTFVGAPETAGIADHLTPDRIDLGSEVDRHALREIDRWVLEYPRGEDELRWLSEDREGYLYRRNGEAIGFAFVGKRGSGPIAALDPADLPDILLHVETHARALGLERLDLQVPAPNEVATRHLLSRGFRLDPWVNLLMSDRPFGRFDRLIAFDPPLFL